VEQELAEEIQFHQSFEAVSGVAQIQEECRDARRVRWLENLVQDFRYGLRLMRKSPGFSAAAVLTIAIGIGAATAIFSVVHGVLLQPLPYREPERLVSLWSRAMRFDLPRAFVNAANWADWKAQTRTLEDIALVRHIANYNLTGEGEPERLQGARVTANLFTVLGVSPARGHTFTVENEKRSNANFVLLSDSLWKRRFGADPAILGRSIQLNGIPYTVLGIMPASFRYPGREFDLWAPLPLEPEDLRDRTGYNYLAVGRLKPGITVAQARADLDAISARLERTYTMNQGIGAGLAPLLDDTVQPVAGALYVLLAAVGCLLLIGAVNVANLLLARGLSRGQERAVRAALGASSGRLVAQAIVEVLPIGGLGAALGVMAASYGLHALIAVLPATMPRIDEIRVSMPVLGFSLLLLVLTSVLVAFWPALQAVSARIAEPLRTGGRANSGGKAQTRVREILVAAEAALTVALVASACLLFRSFSELRAVEPGFHPAHTLTMHLAISRTRYPQDRDVAAYLSRLIDRVEAIPGATAAGMVNRLPIIGGIQGGPIQFEGQNLPVTRVGNADWRTTTPDYFRAVGIPLIAGRTFNDADTPNSRYVGLIDEATARRVWPNQSAIGKRFRIAMEDAPWTEIIGVVGRIHHDSLDSETRTQVYWNYRQRTQDRMALAVRTTGDPAALTAAVIGQIRAVDPEQPVYSVFTMEEILDRSLAQRRLNAALVAVFASVALLLAAIGTYGVVAYSVNQRVREFGIRMALGARSGDVVRIVVARAAAIAGLGAAAGLAISAVLARFLATLLFQVSGTDWLSYSAAAVALIVVAVAASYVPVRRALAADPLISLRGE
jgi:putative ABC transport system permease protein